jgi:hypothetical protein
VTTDEYREIVEAASERMKVVVEMDYKATNFHNELHKEDFLSYWVAVEAYERGYYKGLILNEI